MKFMNKKRFGSTVMAGALALSLAAPAFAANNTSTTITGAYTDIPIAVSVPTTGTAQINPYGLPVTITKSNDTTVDLVGQQITTKPLSVKNQGTVSLDMGVSSFLVTPTGDISIAAAKNTEKEIAVNLEVAGLDDTTLAVSSDSENLDNLIIDAFADEDSWANAITLPAPAFAKGGTAPNPANKNNMAVLGAVTPKSEGFTYGRKSIALFRLTGKLAEEPVNAGAADPWKETDGFSAAIVFKFTPHADVAASVALDNSSLTASIAAGNSGSLTATFNPGDTDLTVTSWAWTSDTLATAVATGSTANGALTYVAAGSAIITVTATLSDNSTVTATCNLTVTA